MFVVVDAWQHRISSAAPTLRLRWNRRDGIVRATLFARSTRFNSRRHRQAADFCGGFYIYLPHKFQKT
jgi:hypothetical protein